VRALAGVVLLLCGCQREPTIVVRFEPNDLAGATAAPPAPAAEKPAVAAEKPAVAADKPAVAADKPAAKPAPVTDKPAAAADKPAPMTDKPAVAADKGAAACKSAADCAVAPVDCCDCSQGGKQHAVARRAAAALAAARKARCKDTMCPMVLSNDPSCAEGPACEKGECVLKHLP
jgi:hypothetical protein